MVGFMAACAAAVCGWAACEWAVCEWAVWLEGACEAADLESRELGSVVVISVEPDRASGVWGVRASVGRIMAEIDSAVGTPGVAALGTRQALASVTVPAI